MKFYLVISAFLALVAQQSTALTVSSSTSQGGTIDQPINEGRRLSVSCDYQLGSGETFTSCLFRKEIPQEFTDNGQSKHFSCALGQPCSSQDQEVNQLVSGAQVTQNSGSCTLNINSADPKLRGDDWTCHIVADSQNNFLQAADQVEVFVSNQSDPIITQPDMRKDSSQAISYSVDSGYGQINAQCTAFGGVPPPQIRWFVDNVNNNEIVQGASATITTGNPRTSGNSVYVESRINFKPTLNDLCSTYNIQDACDVVNGDEDMTTIVFNLICAADQNPYYSFPNNNNNYGQQLNQVKVEVSGSWRVTSSITSLILAFLVAKLSL